jgi:large subunit ribosomal protein LP2
MRHLAAYLLLQIGGNASPTASDIKKLLTVVGSEADDERLDKLISELEGKDINSVSFPDPCMLLPVTDSYAVVRNYS